MHYSYWVSFVILAARVQALTPARYIASRGLGDTCVEDADCVSDDGYPLTCIHPGHSMYGYCQFKDCRYFGCGNHGMDPCVADGENRPWKCGSYLDTAAPSSTQAESLPSSPLAPSSSAATLPPSASSAIATTSLESGQYQAPVVGSDTISFPDPATITDTGIYSIQTSPPTPPSSVNSAASSSDSGSSSVAESPVASDPASDSPRVSSTSDEAGTSAASLESSILSPTTLPSTTRASSASPTSSGSSSGSSSVSATAPNRTTVNASGSPTGGASAQNKNGGFWLAAAGILGVVLL